MSAGAAGLTGRALALRWGSPSAAAPLSPTPHTQTVRPTAHEVPRSGAGRSDRRPGHRGLDQPIQLGYNDRPSDLLDLSRQSWGLPRTHLWTHPVRASAFGALEPAPNARNYRGKDVL